jgi:hypothetical protein
MCAPATAQSDTFTASTLHTSALLQGISRLEAGVRRRQTETNERRPAAISICRRAETAVIRARI